LFYWDQEFKLDIATLEGIYNRKIKVDKDNNVDISRIKKYKSRGFNLEMTLQEELDLLKVLLKTKDCGKHKLFKTIKELPKSYDKWEIKTNCLKHGCLIDSYLSHKVKHKHIFNGENRDRFQNVLMSTDILLK